MDSDVGSLHFTVVFEVTGLLAPSQDIAAFAAAIDRILLKGTPDPNFVRELMGIIHSDQVSLKGAGFQPNFLVIRKINSCATS